MKCLITCLTLCLALAGVGCVGAAQPRDGQTQAVETPPKIPGRWETTPKGVLVFLPSWLTDSTMIVRLFDEIATTVPDPDPRITPDMIGVPPGTRLYIQDPGSYSEQGSPTGLARGHTDMYTYIVCAWRMQPWEKNVLLPALRHELHHFYTKDPCAGHGDCVWSDE